MGPQFHIHESAHFLWEAFSVSLPCAALCMWFISFPHVGNMAKQYPYKKAERKMLDLVLLPITLDSTPEDGGRLEYLILYDFAEFSSLLSFLVS